MTMEEIDALCERINFNFEDAEQPDAEQTAECIALVRQIAGFNKDGEMIQTPDDPEETYEFQESVEDVVTTLHDIVDRARAILNVSAPR